MAQVLIKDIDDAVIEKFRIKAELKGHSLEQELRDVLRRSAPLSTEEKLALIDRAHAMTPKNVVQTPSEILIREDRDNDDPYR